MDFKQRLEEEKSKLVDLFHEMLEYKNISYDNDASFLDLLELVSIHYNSFSTPIDFVYYGIKYGSFPPSYDERDDDVDYEITDEMNLENLKDLYEALTEKDNDYKVHAHDYIDINLKEGQTLKELADEYEAKFGLLLREMLEFINEKVPDGKADFYDLWHTVGSKYPWYYQMLDRLHFVRYTSLHSNYVDQIDSMNRVYNNLSKYKEEYPSYIEQYKDIIEERKAWLEEVESLKKANEMDKYHDLLFKDPYYKIMFGDDDFDLPDLDIDIEEE